MKDILAMHEPQIETLRTKLLAALADLDDQDSAGDAGQEVVQLDQQAVGRLSRMDALQQQSMAKAAATLRRQMRARITAVLGRIDQAEYGYCTTCEEEISPQRLELDPTAPTCISCASGRG